MAATLAPVAQPFLPGLEPRAGGAPLPPASRRAARTARSQPKAPPLEKLLAQAGARVRKLMAALRAELKEVAGLSERVAYDESAGAFFPAYAMGERELLRLHLDPVLAATVTLEQGDRELALLQADPGLPESLRAKLVPGARRSGRRIFIALLVRNQEEVLGLAALVRRSLTA